MKVDKLISFLEDNDVEYKDAGERIYLQHCYECGNGKWKVSFQDTNKEFKVIYGRCFRCGAEFSTFRYLLDVGFSIEAVKGLHNFEHLSKEKAEAEFIDLLEMDDKLREVSSEKVEYAPKGMAIPELFRISSWPKHPASLYAIKRGVPPELFDDIMIDPKTNSVAFLCRQNGSILGWQKRFVSPPTPNFKTMNPPADQFKKSMHVIEYPNSGPIAICEGPFTGVAAWHFGYHAIVTFGSAVSKAQIKRISEIVKETRKEVFVSFDLDPAGFRGFFKIKNYFTRREVEVKRLRPETGNDLNDSWKEGKRAMVVENDPYDSTVPVLEIFSEFYRD